jgi:hemoglobin-like flavoprotein
MNPMTIEKQVELVNDSFERCISYSTFFDRFYERFGESSDEISGKFHEVDFEKQNRALRDAFYSLFRAIAGEPDAWQELEMRAVRHSRTDLDIEPWMYAVWLDCLLETIREIDPAIDDQTEAAWRDVMAIGIKFMIERY